MVQLSPDTFNDGWDWSSGYHHSDESLMGFSHTHLSGTGVGDMLDVLVMPGRGRVKLNPSSRDTPERGYRARFSHEDEIATPGYYAVRLRDLKVLCELTATTRVGMHRYTFPAGQTTHLLVDFAHAYHQTAEMTDVFRWVKFRAVGDDTLVGGRCVRRWAGRREIYFAMKFSKPWSKVEVFADGIAVADPHSETTSPVTKCVAHFDTGDQSPVLVKCGISGVSIEGALANLQAEIPGWDFDAVRNAAAAEWERELSKIKVEGGTEKQKTIFYTSLYHSLIAPTIFDDVDGKYRGMDLQVHTLPPGQHNFSTFSLWDTFRAAHPLYALVQRERVPLMVNCLARMAQESAGGLPIWPLQGVETFCMTGYHSVVVVAEAIAKGLKGLDLERIYPSMRKRAFEDDYRSLATYRALGFLPADVERESVSNGMDFAYDDWAIAHVAEALGHHDDARALLKRAGNYRNFYDPRVRFMRPRLANGEFPDPFDPSETRYSPRWADFTEANPWQATFAVQHDPKGLADLLGGPAQLERKLDDLFDADPTLPEKAAIDIAGMVGQYAHGNEVSHHIAYLYVYAGAPHKTQQRIASLLETMYDDQPAGLAGNEDCGQMSAWYCMSAMGFYAVDPVSGNYVLGTPMFDKVTLQMEKGKELIVEARRSSAEAIYISSATLNGKHLQGAWFRHADIAEGGRLILQMSTRPAPFGSSAAAAPPSMTA